MEGQFIQEGCSLNFTAVAACQQGDVVLLPGGVAGIVAGNVIAGQQAAAQVEGVVKLPKTASIYLLPGGDAYWDVSAAKVNFKAESGTNDFFIGSIVLDAVGSDTYCYVDLNRRTRHTIDLERGGQEWTEALTGSGPPTLAVRSGGVLKANIINTNEAQAVTVKSVNGIPFSAKPILETRFTRVAASNNTLDLDIAFASGVSTTDFEAVASFAAVHLDGGDNKILVHSDDGTTDRAPADSTYVDVDGTENEVWIDMRDDTNVKVYSEGRLVDTSASKLILTAALTTTAYAVASIEKSTGTATGEMRVSRLRVRHQAE